MPFAFNMSGSLTWTKCEPLSKPVMHTSGRVEDESSRVSSGRVAHSRVQASGVDWRQEQWHNAKRVG
jgi:hypothetical protein